MSLHYASTGKLKTQFMFTSSEALPIIKEIVAPKSTIVNEALIVPVTDLYQEFENIFSAFYPDGIPMTPEEVFEACEHFQDWSKGENTRYSNGVEKVVIDDVIGIDFEVFGAWFCSLLFNQLHDVVTNRLLDHTLRQVLSMRRRHPSLSIPSYLGSCRSQEEGSSRTFSELYMMGVPVQIPERERSLQLAALALLEKQKGSLQGIEESKDEEGIVDGVDECKGDDEYKENGCAEMERTVKIESLADNKVETERVVVNLDSIEVGIDGVEDGGEGTKEDGWKDVGGEGVMEVVEEKGEAAEEKGDDTVLEIHEIIVAEMEVVGDEGLMVEEIVAVIIEHEVVVIEKEEEMVLQKEQVVPEKEVEVVVAVVEEEMVVAEEANHDSIDPIPHPDQLESEEVRVLMEDVYTGKEVYIIPDEKETLPVEEVDEEEEVMMVGVEVGAEVGDEEGGVEGDEVVVRMDQVYSGKEVYVIDEEDKKNEDQFRSNGRMDESAISMISVTSVIDQGEEEGEEEQEEVGEEEGEEEGDETINEDDMCVNMQHSYSTEKGSEGTTMENVQENKQGNGLTELRTEKLSPWRDVYSMVNLDSPDSVVTQSFISPLQSGTSVFPPVSLLFLFSFCLYSFFSACILIYLFLSWHCVSL